MSTFFEKVKYSIFPFLEFKKKNLSLVKKVYISLNTIAMVFMMIFILLYFFSYAIYSHKFEDKNMELYANFPMSENIAFRNSLKKTKEKLKKDDLYFDDYKVKVHIVENDLLFTIHSMFMDMVAVNLVDSIFINKNKLLKKDYIFEEIVHEVIHTFQAEKYGGWLKYRFNIPYWVLEGYPVYVSRKNLSRAYSKFMKYCSKHHFNNLSTSDTYRLNGLLVKHAIEKLNKSVDDLHLGKVNYDEVLDSLLREYNVTKGAN